MEDRAKTGKGYGKIAEYLIVSFVFMLLSAIFIFMGRNISGIAGDIGDGYYSVLAGNASVIMNGELPLWNPYQWGGFSNVGHIFGAFYPVLWILYFIFWNSETQMLSYLIIPFYSWIHISLASLGLYLLVQRIVKKPYISCSIVCMGIYSGSMLRGYGWAYIFISFCWIPWMIFFFMRSLEEKGKKAYIYAALSSVVLGMIGLGSTSHGILFAGLTMFFILLAFVVSDTRNWIGLLKKAIFIGLCGMGIASVQFIPFVEFMLRAYRFVPTESGVMDYPAFIEHVVPATEMHSLLGNHAGFYGMGITLFLLSVLSLFVKRKEKRPVILGAKMIWVFTLFMMSGTIITDFFYYIPGFHSIREQFLYAPYLAISSCLLSADAVSVLLDKLRGSQLELYRPAYLILPLLYLISLLPENNLDGMKGFALKILFAVMVMIYALKRMKARQKIVCISGLMFVIAAGDFIIYRNNTINSDLYLSVKETEEKVKKVNFAMRSLKEDLQIEIGERILSWGGVSAYPSNIGSTVGICDGFAYINPSWKKAMDIHKNMELDKRIQVMNIGHVLASAENEEDFLEWFANIMGTPDHIASMYGTYDDEQMTDLFIYNKQTPGTGWLVYNCEFYDAKAEAAEVIGMINQEAFNPSDTVLVNRSNWKDQYQPQAKGGQSETELVEYCANSVKLKCRTDAAAILVTSEYAYPGWKVYVDGKKADLLEVNYAFRGVYLPEGEHKVEFCFQPTSFKLGLLSLAAACAVLSYVCSKRFQMKKEGIKA